MTLIIPIIIIQAFIMILLFFRAFITGRLLDGGIRSGTMECIIITPGIILITGEESGTILPEWVRSLEKGSLKTKMQEGRL